MRKHIVSATNVFGAGERSCREVFVCQSLSDINRLRVFNCHYEDYILLYKASYVSREMRHTDSALTYVDACNAAVFIELPNWVHAMEAILHWGEDFLAAEKFFGILNRKQTSQRSVIRMIKKTGIKIFPGGFALQTHVTVDSVEDRLMVFI